MSSSEPRSKSTPRSSTPSAAGVRTKTCDGCGKRREAEEWRIRHLTSGQTQQVAFCVECAVVLHRAVSRVAGLGAIQPVPISALKPTPALRRQARGGKAG